MPESVENDKETKQPESPKTNETTTEVIEEPVKQMKAVVLTGFGGLKALKLMEKPEPAVKEGHVLIKVKSCGLNFQDLMARQGAIDIAPKTPFIMGIECAGDVVAVGENVEIKVGSRVAALTDYGSWAEFVVCPANNVFPIPKNMSYNDAVAITLSSTVAYMMLFEIGNLKKGKTVLVHSAGGAVGLAISQLCKTVPDVTLIGVASSNKHEAIKDSFTHLIERGQDYCSEVRKISPEGVDLVLDCLCGEDCNKGYSLLKPMGTYILYGSSNIVTGETKSFFSAAKSWWQVDKVSPLKLYEENRTLSGFNLRHLLYVQNQSQYVKDIVKNVMDLWKSKNLKSVIDSTWALDDVAEAMQKMHDRKNVGKIIFDLSLERKVQEAKPAENEAGK